MADAGARATWRLQVVQLLAPLHLFVRAPVHPPGQCSLVQLHWMVRAPQLVLQQQWRLQLGQARAPLRGPLHLGMALAQHPGQPQPGRAPAHQIGQLLETQHLEQAQALRPGQWPVLQPQEQAEVQSGEACPTRPSDPLRAPDPALLQLWRSPAHAPQALGHSAHPQSLCLGLTSERLVGVKKALQSGDTSRSSQASASPASRVHNVLQSLNISEGKQVSFNILNAAL